MPEILIKNTLAFQVCALYRIFKKSFPDDEPARIVLRKQGEDFEQIVTTRKEEIYQYIMDKNNPLAKDFLKKFEEVPYKAMVLNFNPQ